METINKIEKAALALEKLENIKAVLESKQESVKDTINDFSAQDSSVTEIAKSLNEIDGCESSANEVSRLSRTLVDVSDTDDMSDAIAIARNAIEQLKDDINELNNEIDNADPEEELEEKDEL